MPQQDDKDRARNAIETNLWIIAIVLASAVLIAAKGGYQTTTDAIEPNYSTTIAPD
jgi:hypothetical protein